MKFLKFIAVLQTHLELNRFFLEEIQRDGTTVYIIERFVEGTDNKHRSYAAYVPVLEQIAEGIKLSINSTSKTSSPMKFIILQRKTALQRTPDHASTWLSLLISMPRKSSAGILRRMLDSSCVFGYCAMKLKEIWPYNTILSYIVISAVRKVSNSLSTLFGLHFVSGGQWVVFHRRIILTNKLLLGWMLDMTSFATFWQWIISRIGWEYSDFRYDQSELRHWSSERC